MFVFGPASLHHMSELFLNHVGERKPCGWAISIYDATRFAAGNDDAVLFRPRVVTSAMGLVFALVIVAAVSITGGGTTP